MIDPQELFDQYVAIDSMELRQRFAFTHPVLFSGSLLNAAQARGSGLSGERATAWQRSLAELAGGRELFLDDPSAYPLRAGLGPIEKILAPLEAGEISFDEAVVRAKKAGPYVSLAYSNALRAQADLAAEDAGRRPFAVQSQEVVLAAADAMPEGGDKTMVQATARQGLVEIAKLSLADVPDGRLWDKAVAASDWVLALAQRLGRDSQLQDAEFLAGSLRLDVYTTGKPCVRYPVAVRAWRARLEDELGGVEAAAIQAAHPMPEPEQALRTALEHLRRAAKYPGVPLRVGAWKAIVQTLGFMAKGLDLAIDLDELRAAAFSALEMLDPSSSPARQVRGFLEAFEISVPDAPTGGGAIRHDPGPGKTTAAHQLLTEAASVVDSDPERAWRILHDAAPVFRDGEARLQSARYTQMVSAAKRMVPAGAQTEVNAPGDAARLARALEERASKERWTELQLGAGILFVAAATTSVNDESAGLVVLQSLAETTPHFAEEHRELLRFVGASLLDGEAVNFVTAGRLLDAIKSYMQSVRLMLTLSSRDLAHKGLWGMVDVLGRLPKPAEALPYLASVALPAEAALERRATELLQHACYAILWSMSGQKVNQTVNAQDVAIVFSLIKGHQLAAALGDDSRYDPLDDAAVRAQLDALAGVERTIPPAELAADARGGLTDVAREIVLGSYLSPETPRGGSDAKQVVQNLRHRIDHHIGERLASSLEPRMQKVDFDDELRKCLDPETVLVDFVLHTSTADPLLQVMTLRLLTPETTHIVTHHVRPVEGAGLVLTIQGRAVRGHNLLPDVALTRRAIQEDMEEEQAGATDSETETMIADVSSIVLSPTVAKRLEQLASTGKRYLTFVAHGPMHFMPMHVLSMGATRLADHWTVTQLPNVALVRRRASRAAVPTREGAAAFGLTFGEEHPFALRPLENAALESQEVAAAMGVEATPESRATKAAVLDALESCRWVHLATHGAQDIEAAAFHHVFLTPTDTDDGRLFAYELLGKRLDGLEVLTLSACESGLGRFDESDNLRGLPASLLRAGCQAIVGTLWEVEDSASRQFFTTFYRALRDGASVRDAFGTAQKTVRAERRALRDWAPFYLIEG